MNDIIFSLEFGLIFALSIIILVLLGLWDDDMYME